MEVLINKYDSSYITPYWYMSPFQKDSMSQHSEDEHPFYGIEIIRRQEHEYIQKILGKYKNEAVSEDLKAKIWDELQMEKYKGNITIPFKVLIHRDMAKKFPDYVEVILDTKV